MTYIIKDYREIVDQMRGNQVIINNKLSYRNKTHGDVMSLLDLNTNINDIFPNYALFIRELVELHKTFFDYLENEGIKCCRVKEELYSPVNEKSKIYLSIERIDEEEVDRHNLEVRVMSGSIEEDGDQVIRFWLEYPTGGYMSWDDVPAFKLSTFNEHNETIHDKIGFDENLYIEFSKITELFIKELKSRDNLVYYGYR